MKSQKRQMSKLETHVMLSRKSHKYWNEFMSTQTQLRQLSKEVKKRRTGSLDASQMDGNRTALNGRQDQPAVVDGGVGQRGWQNPEVDSTMKKR